MAKAGSSDNIFLGKALDKDRITAQDVVIPLRTLTLHGMIGGSTGTGKSRAIQLISEQLVEQGIPVLLADLKGDMSGFVRPGSGDKVKERAKAMKLPYSPKSFPTNFFSVSGSFVPLRIRLDEIDPSLLARVLGLNETQESNMKIAMLYAQAKELPVRDLVDLQNLLSHLSQNLENAPGISKSSIGVILRAIGIAVGDGMNELFGEPSISIQDLIVPKVNLINLSNWRKKSEMPSIMMGFILYRLFHELPDIGHVDKPKIVLFIDEAHYLFQDANPSLVNLFVTILKQIRSKGVSVFFCSQNPEDIPEKILEQLGCKIQFALRAFTKEEIADIRGIADAFPPTKMKIAEALQELKIGEAIASPLDEDGKPMSPVKVMVAPPRSFMDVVPDEEIEKTLDVLLMEKYCAIAQIERYDLSEPLKIKFVERRSSWDAAQKEEAKYARKETYRVNRQWNVLKWIGIFIILAMVLGIIIFLLFIIFVLK
jgi:hypothetical protein